MQEIIINVDEDKNKIVALMENGKLVEKYDEVSGQNRLEGNIYIGKVENVLYGMQAAFVNIGEEKNTFMQNFLNICYLILCMEIVEYIELHTFLKQV